jgi:hypothetical protein
MLLEIEDTKTITEFQEEFNIRFPYLKMEFFPVHKRKSQEEEGEDPITHHAVLGDIRKKHNPGVLEVLPWSRVRFVEEELYKHFGFNVRIYRLQGRDWVRIEGTDELTLKEQNEIGQSAANVEGPVASF